MKNNVEGIGCSVATPDDMFRASQDMFSDVLARLNSGVVKEDKKEESIETTVKKYSARAEMYYFYCFA